MSDEAYNVKEYKMIDGNGGEVEAFGVFFGESFLFAFWEQEDAEKARDALDKSVEQHPLISKIFDEA